MRQIFMYLKQSQQTSWQPLNDSTKDVAALTNFTIDWGTDSAFEQPDPAVLSGTLRDKSGNLAGRAATLAGARIIVQLSRQIDYSMLVSLGSMTYSQADVPLDRLHYRIQPTVPGTPSNGDVTIFDGIISSGTSITRKNNAWRLKIKAVSRMVLWRRLADNGPSSIQGYHWTGTPAERLKELNARAAKAGAPQVDASSVDLPPSVAPYETNSHPSQLELLQRLYGHSLSLPIWGEYPNGASTVIKPYRIADTAVIWMDSNGNRGTIVGNDKRQALPASKIPDISTLEMPAPRAGLTISAHTAHLDNNKLQVEDSTISIADTSKTGDPTAAGNWITIDSDTCTANSAAGKVPGAAYMVSESERASVRYTLKEFNRRTSYQLTIDSNHIDPEQYPELYETRPSGPEIIQGSIYGRLIDDELTPITLNAFTTIGGTLSYELRDNTPMLTHELHTTALPRSVDRMTWNRFTIRTPYEKAKNITIAALSVISTTN